MYRKDVLKAHQLKNSLTQKLTNLPTQKLTKKLHRNGEAPVHAVG